MISAGFGRHTPSDSSGERTMSPRGPVAVSATMCATKPKFLSSVPEIRSPINDLLQPGY